MLMTQSHQQITVRLDPSSACAADVKNGVNQRKKTLARREMIHTSGGGERSSGVIGLIKPTAIPSGSSTIA